ncbi:MAG: purple acid phosphatase family protein [Isosphaeraceae bacterium]
MRVKRFVALLSLLVLVWGCNHAAEPVATEAKVPVWKAANASPFLVEPYLQWGDSPDANHGHSLEVVWQTDDFGAEWDVQYGFDRQKPWLKADPLAMRRIVVPSIPPHRLYRAHLPNLQPGGRFSYRVRNDGVVAFGSDATAPKAVDSHFRFVVLGDCGANTQGQKALAFQTYRLHPDFVMITGDIVYDRGRISEYREKFWPIYNANGVSPDQGAPIMRSTVFFAAPGNHDIVSRDLGKYPDGLAYFLYWLQPLSGPAGQQGDAALPRLLGPEANQQAFRDAAGEAYPRMANFSFDYGNSHWTVLDGNPYVDWRDPKLRDWVKTDLSAASKAAWRFVVFHQPAFNSSRAHFDEQNTRRLADLFEEGKVDVAFSGHVHNYQRTFPLHFVAEKVAGDKEARKKGHVPGRWTLDRSFDGQKVTHPNGVIYLTTGAGGAKLYNPEQQDDPSSWQEFTHKFVSKVHSLTVAEVEGPKLTIRQISLDGKELDKFVVTK